MSVQVNPSSAGGAGNTANTLPWWRVALRTLNRVATALTLSEWAFAALVFFCYVYFITPAGTNTVSRYDMVYALAHGGVNIDLHASNTIDVSYFHGHWYSPRSLGLSLAAVPVLFVLGHFVDLDNYAGLTLTQQIALLNAFTLAPAAARRTSRPIWAMAAVVSSSPASGPARRSATTRRTARTGSPKSWASSPSSRRPAATRSSTSRATTRASNH